VCETGLPAWVCWRRASLLTTPKRLRLHFYTGGLLIRTYSGLAPEIAHFRIASDKLDSMGYVPRDWYIKGAR